MHLIQTKEDTDTDDNCRIKYDGNSFVEKCIISLKINLSVFLTTFFLHRPDDQTSGRLDGSDESQNLCATSFSTSPPDPYISQSSLATTPTSSRTKMIPEEKNNKPMG